MWKHVLKDLNFPLTGKSPEKTLNNFKGSSTSKVAGIDIFLGKFLEDQADILVAPMYQLFNRKVNSFLRTCKIAKVKLSFKKGCKISSFYQILLKTLFKTKHRKICVRTNFSKDFNPVYWNYFNWFTKSVWPQMNSLNPLSVSQSLNYWHWLLQPIKPTNVAFLNDLFRSSLLSVLYK